MTTYVARNVKNIPQLDGVFNLEMRKTRNNDIVLNVMKKDAVKRTKNGKEIEKRIKMASNS